MASKADEVLRRIERDARDRWCPIIGPRKGRILADLVRQNKPKRILEIGTLIGYSAITMGKELNGNSEIVTIEIDEREAEMARRNIEEAELKPEVKVIVGDALEVIPQLEGIFDMVFIDAAKDEYLEYLRLVEGKIREGAVVVADNVGPHVYMTRDYLDYVMDSDRYASRFIPVGRDGIAVSVRL
ncbi:hypothetical protein DRO42_00740 [Candidatus Bathyarchaeota archaeon]|nr:MAG: hypothetical protein DRO42_00740 [Candidatus Bathyarchaeota archaeon]